MYDDVLVPTDGSEGSAVAVERAIDLADRYDADLHALYVVEPTPISGEAAAGALAALDEVGQEAVDQVRERAERADVPVQASVGRGIPHEVILDYVDEHDVDLVVMGTHGRTGLDRYVIGSVTEKIVRLADVPVLTVPLPEADEEAS